MANISMKALLEAGVHFGHQTRRWNPKMQKFIFGSRNKIHIVDLQKTVKELKKAYKFVRDTVADGKTLLFVGTKKQAKAPIKEEAKRCGAYFICERWLGGTLTNFSTIQKSINALKEMDKMKADGIFKIMSKKEASKREKERVRLEKSFEGIKDMSKLPDLLFVIDPIEEATAIAEARKLKIPIVSVVDTNCNPELIDHPIPGNDDAIRAVKLFCGVIADAVVEGNDLAQRESNVQKEDKPNADEIPASGLPADEIDKDIALDAEPS